MLPGTPAYKQTFIQDLLLTSRTMINDANQFFSQRQREGYELYTASSDGQLVPNVIIEYEGDQDHPKLGDVAVYSVTLKDLRPHSEKAFAGILPIIAQNLSKQKFIEEPLYFETEEEQRAAEEYTMAHSVGEAE